MSIQHMHILLVTGVSSLVVAALVSCLWELGQHHNSHAHTPEAAAT